MDISTRRLSMGPTMNQQKKATVVETEVNGESETKEDQKKGFEVHGKNPSHTDAIGSSRKKDFEPEQGTSDYMVQKSRGEFKKDWNSIDENGTNIEPCYFNSSIYYGGRQMYSPTSQNNNSKNIFEKDGGDVHSNENDTHIASRGNWWQGSLYY